MKTERNNSKGFTLIELLIVIAIVMIMTGVILNMNREGAGEQDVQAVTQQVAANAEESASAATELESQAIQLRAQGQAAAVRLNGEADAAALRAVGAAKADAYKQGMEALGADGYTAVQVATILGEHKVKVVPDIAVSGESASGLASVLMARLIQSSDRVQSSDRANDRK